MIVDEKKNILSIVLYLHGNTRSIGEIEKYLHDHYPEYADYEIYRFSVEAGLPKGDYGQTVTIGFLKRPAIKDKTKDSRTFVVGV